MIKQHIQDMLKDAMRAKDALKLETLRYVLSTIKYGEIDKQRELTEEEVIDVLSKEVKKRREAIELFKSSGRSELVTEEETKLAVITDLLPAQMSKEEIEKLVDEVLLEVGKDNMGVVMKALMPKTKGKADGKLVSEVVKQKISS